MVSNHGTRGAHGTDAVWALAARELGPADGAVLRRDGFAMFARMTSAAFMAHLHYREIFDALMR